MNPWVSMTAIWFVCALMMSAGWWWQRRRDNIGIVDVLWAVGLGASATGLGVLGDGGAWPRALLALAGGTWGLRLAWHLWRRVSREPEDGRYRQLREHWHGNQVKLFLFFQFQALSIVLFALPFLAVARNGVVTLTPYVAIAAAIWILSVVGESIADRQLASFRADPNNRGRTCRSGLWRYSRHPNYFFEWLHWFTYVALAVGSPVAPISWLGPLTMFVFLRWISGIPYTEAQALRTRGDDYRDYQEHTPMLFPWFPTGASSSRATRPRIHP